MPRATSFEIIDEPSSRNKCNECGIVLAHHHDLRRHMRTHGLGIVQPKFKCSWTDCSFETLQKSNLNTHYRTHSQDKSKACPHCTFRTCDPASLTRHRKRFHNYVPKPRKARAIRIQEKVSSLEISTSLALTSAPSGSALDLSFNSSYTSPLSLSNSECSSSLSISHPAVGSSPDSFTETFLHGFPSNSQGPYNQSEKNDSDWGGIYYGPPPRPLLPAMESTATLEALVSDYHIRETSLLLQSSPTTMFPFTEDPSFYNPSDRWSSGAAFQNVAEYTSDPAVSFTSSSSAVTPNSLFIGSLLADF